MVQANSGKAAMAKHGPSFICQSCGAAGNSQGKCDAWGAIQRAPRCSFASLLMSVPSGDFERDQTPVRDVDL